MALQFDGNGLVTIPTWTATGAFTLDIPALTLPSATEVIIGDNGNQLNYIAYLTGGTIRVRIGNTNRNITGFVDGQAISGISLVRDVSDNLTITINGVVESTTVLASTFILNTFGAYDSGNLPFTGLLGGIVSFTGGTEDRSYDFDQPELSTTLPDSISSQDGTLTGFTSGGFLPVGGSSIIINTISDYQCLLGDNNSQAAFTVGGSTTTTSPVEYQLDAGAWQTLDAAPSTTFTGSVTVTGQQDITVRISDEVGVTDSVVNITATDYNIALWWQSNEAGRGINNNALNITGGNPVPIKYQNGTFSPADDATGIDGTAAGSLASRLAQRYSDDGKFICLANVAQGGSSILAWQKGGSYYERIENFAAGVGGLSFTSSVGGETDSLNGMSTADMITHLTQTCTDLNTDFGTSHFLTYFPVASGTGTTENVNNTRAAFDSVITNNAFVIDGGDLSVLDISSTTNANNDDLHIKLDADFETGADIRYAAFTAVDSTFNFTVTGLSSTTREVKFFDWANDTHLKTETVSFDGVGFATTSLSVPVSTVIFGGYIGANPPTTGSGIYGVTV
jgi:hypothetical protein